MNKQVKILQKLKKLVSIHVIYAFASFKSISFSHCFFFYLCYLARHLQKLHTQRLKINFGDDVIKQQENAINTQVDEIATLIKNTDNNIKRIGMSGADPTLTQQDKRTRLNVMKSLAVELQTCAKYYKQCRNDFMKNLKEQQKIGDEIFPPMKDDNTNKPMSFEDALNNGLTPQQLNELQLLNQQASEREKEIIKVAQSINELAILFKDLNMLIVEQGTVLDRIDYNIDQSLTKIKRGVVDLEAAEKQSRKALTMKCIIILGIVLFVLLIVLIWEKSGNN